MPSTERVKDFAAYSEQPFPGMIVPKMFNDDEDDGSGYPGLQRAVFNRTTWWLHSGNMDSGLHLAGYDITGVNLLYVDNITGNVDHYGDWSGDASYSISGYGNLSVATGVIERGILSPYESSSEPFNSGTQDGELFWDTVTESMYRWEVDIEAWIEIGT